MFKALFFIYFSLLTTLFSDIGITYDFSGGRFGDNLLTYLHAKWLSYTYNIPLLYKPFNYSNHLLMHLDELQYSDYKNHYKKEVVLNNKHPLPIRENRLYVCSYFPAVENELKSGHYFTFPINWKNQEFRALAKQMLTPIHSLTLTYPPQNQLSIAIHIREGGGVDDPNHKFKDPLKMPPVTFYSASLKKILELFPQEKFYCHVFTDALEPESWIQNILSNLPDKDRVSFHFRKELNRHDLNVLEDFFSLFNFDILIRAESNYSIVASLIHDYLVVCFPKKYSIQDKIVSIDEITFEVNEELFHNYAAQTYGN